MAALAMTPASTSTMQATTGSQVGDGWRNSQTSRAHERRQRAGVDGGAEEGQPPERRRRQREVDETIVLRRDRGTAAEHEIVEPELGELDGGIADRRRQLAQRVGGQRLPQDRRLLGPQCCPAGQIQSPVAVLRAPQEFLRRAGQLAQVRADHPAGLRAGRQQVGVGWPVLP